MEGTARTLLCLYAMALSVTANSEQAEDVKYGRLSANKYSNISCYECTYSDHGQNCHLLMWPKPFNTSCLAGQQYCMVERYLTNNIQQTFTRKCASECMPGCEKVGKYYVIEKCYSCCQHNLCNTDNAAPVRTTPQIVSTALTLSIVLLILH